MKQEVDRRTKILHTNNNGEIFSKLHVDVHRRKLYDRSRTVVIALYFQPFNT